MKSFFIIPISVLLFSCGTPKEVVTVVAEKATNSVEDIVKKPKNYRFIGTVHLIKEDCGLYILTQTAPGKFEKLYPVHLAEKFKKEGVKIKFKYEFSKVLISKSCPADYTVTIEDVVRMRS